MEDTNCEAGKLLFWLGSLKWLSHFSFRCWWAGNPRKVLAQPQPDVGVVSTLELVHLLLLNRAVFTPSKPHRPLAPPASGIIFKAFCAKHRRYRASRSAGALPRAGRESGLLPVSGIMTRMGNMASMCFPGASSFPGSHFALGNHVQIWSPHSGSTIQVPSSLRHCRVPPLPLPRPAE